MSALHGLVDRIVQTRDSRQITGDTASRMHNAEWYQKLITDVRDLTDTILYDDDDAIRYELLHIMAVASAWQDIIIMNDGTYSASVETLKCRITGGRANHEYRIHPEDDRERLKQLATALPTPSCVVGVGGIANQLQAVLAVASSWYLHYDA